MTIFTVNDDYGFDSDELILFPLKSYQQCSNIPDQSWSYTEVDEPIQVAVGCPPVVAVILNERCNLNCVYCSESSTTRHTSMTMSVLMKSIEEFLLKYVIQNIKTGYEEPFRIVFTGGGEPTFDWDLFKEAVDSI